MMTKEDYMKLDKERLAELLVEKEQESYKLFFPNPSNDYIVPCYAPDGTCMNPQMDCINCPKYRNTGGWVSVPPRRWVSTSTDNVINKSK